MCTNGKEQPHGSTSMAPPREASEALVKLAEQKWREEEGSYRDDITCIVANIPFLEEVHAPPLVFQQCRSSGDRTPDNADVPE